MRAILLSIEKTAALAAFILLLSTSGCIRYWENVNKLEQENFEMSDQLKWQEREQATQVQQAKDAQPADAPLEASDY